MSERPGERPGDRGPLDFDLGDEPAARAGSGKRDEPFASASGEGPMQPGAAASGEGPMQPGAAAGGEGSMEPRAAAGGEGPMEPGAAAGREGSMEPRAWKGGRAHNQPAGSGRRPIPSQRVGRPGGTYLWVVGVAALVLVLVLVVSTLQHGAGRGARGVANGAVVPPFAVPLALSNLDGDANLATKPGEGQAGNRPACEVRGPRVLNGCALREHGPFVLAFFTTGGRCVAELDAMERARRRVPGVQFAAVAIRGDRGTARSLIRAHRWSFPVGYDRDGALANAYHVQVCPQLTFARRGGRVVETTFGDVRTAQLTAKALRLLGR